MSSRTKHRATLLNEATIFCLDMCEKINSPRSLTVAILLRNKMWDELATLEIDPSHYTDVKSFALDFQATSLLKKWQGLPTSFNLKWEALSSFLESEELCGQKNEEFLYMGDHELPPEVRRAKSLIDEILGFLSEGVLREISENFGFGPGAQTSLRGTGSIQPDRFAIELDCTHSLAQFQAAIKRDLYSDTFNWYESTGSCNVVPGSKSTTVPKSAKTDRFICIEPGLNIYVQKGIGAVMKRKLSRFGYSIDTQDRNRLLAQHAYKKRLATIDLSSASDSVSYGLVERMLPPRWFHLLDLCRSPRTRLPDGSYHHLEKFSSMGNGYTFELETLIFLSVALSVVDEASWDLVTVFGDDIIVPQEDAPRVIELLEFLGFRVNRAKSFLAGSFFESCGHDYFCGVNVRPFFLKEDGIDTQVPFHLQVANKLRLWLDKLAWDGFSDSTFRPVWESLIAKVPPLWRVPVPIDFGDQGVIGMDPPKMDVNQGYPIRYIPLSIRKRRDTRPAQWFLTLNQWMHNARLDMTKGRYPRRGLFGRIKPRKTRSFTWLRVAPWS